MSFECAPVLLVNFCRPDFTKDQIEKLREVKPRRVFFAVDGPRPGKKDDETACAKVRALADAIDWPCELKTLFQEKNLGCKYAPVAAITWFFENVEAGIILEDDVCPSADFMRFASELLVRYKDDERVGMISGFNRYNLQTDGSTSYHFNTHADIWGWATWRRVWRHYDVDMKPYLEDWEGVVSKRLPTKRGRHDFICGVNAVINGLQTWDYQFGLMFMARGYLAAVPKGKLVTNRGVNEERGSNTQGYMFDLHHIVQLGSIVFPLVHPAEVAADIEALNLEERRQFGIIPRVITWFGCKVPCLGGTLDAIGRCLERVVPSMFRI